ncbi:hypothetical protein [Chryseobacterium indoltheticum]|uniref:hypothetical protein n=1 Tax=Chryseobacterium indoltheticum TaxID=254 RepID=UPI003F4957FE
MVSLQRCRHQTSHIGFKFTDDQLFWMAAMPGLVGGLLRIVNTFLIPIYGTRKQSFPSVH